MISVDYIQCMKYLILNISVEFKTLNFIKVSFLDNVLGRKLAGKNGLIVDSISTDSVLFGVSSVSIWWKLMKLKLG